MNKLAENIFISEGGFENEKDYWLAKIDGILEFSCFPQMSIDAIKEQSDIHLENQRFPPEISDKLFSVSNNSPYALYMVLLSGILFLLKKYSGENRISAGMPYYKQNLNENENQFPNKIFPVILEISDQDTFKNILLKIKEAIDGINKNRNYPLNKVFKAAGIHSCHKSASLFNVIAAYDMIHEELFYLNEPADILFVFHSNENDISMDIYYNAMLYPLDFIKSVIEYLFHFYREALKNTHAPVQEILIPGSEREKILCNFNNTKAEFPFNKTVHQLFEEQAAKTPDNVCLIEQDKKVTYKEFNEKVNQLAWFLKEKGITPDSITAILFDRGLEMMTAIFAILKAGGAYLPIDPEYPESRKLYLLNDSRALYLLTTDTLAAGLSWDKEVVTISYEKIFHQNRTNPPNINKHSDLVYIIYTSGSTGNPKGTMIEHQSLVNRLHWGQKKFQFNELDIILQKTPYTFDVSLYEIFCWSLAGASLYILQPQGEKYPDLIIDVINQNHITAIHFVPSMLSSFLEYTMRTESAIHIKSLKRVFCSGEALRPDIVERFYAITKGFSDAIIVNLYGPTETCVEVSCYECDKKPHAGKVPIGKPIDNIKLYVLDEGKRLAAVGVTGELYISGIGVARGYLNQDKLTGEKFLPDTISNEGRMYRTGDLARWLPCGNIECLGRIDHQAKVRGFRIEPGEIESLLLKHQSIIHAVVIVREDHKKENYLCAYLVSNEPLDQEVIKEFLKSSLPQYMVPSFFVFLNKIPLMSNGKVDRKRLPDPLQQLEERESDIHFNNITDIKLHQIWRSVLGIENISYNDNFFTLGGNSLKATELIARIHETFKCKISVKDIFDNPAISKLSIKIQAALKSTLPPIPVAEKQEYYPLSAAQKRIYISNQLSANSIAFNMPGAIIIDGNIKIEKLKSAFNTLIMRHEVLRTSFILQEDEPVLLIHDNCKIELLYEDADGRKLDSIIEKTDFIQPFDITKAPLLRVKLMRLEKTKYLLLYDMHHLISDGVSFKILAKEVHEIYSGNQLPALRIGYKDYVIWQNSLYTNEFMKNQEIYWTKKLSAPIPELKLPIDFPSTGENNFNAGIHQLKMNKEMTAKLRSAAAVNQSTLFMLLLSAYFVLLYKYTNSNDIIVGIPLSGRQYADLESLIGMFVNMGAFRSSPAGNKKFAEFMTEIKQEAFEIYENQDYQFDWLVNALGTERRTNRNPFFNTVFALQDVSFDNIENDFLRFSPCRIPYNITKFELVFIAQEETDKIIIEIQYILSLFKKTTIEKISSHYYEILKQIAVDSSRYINEIKISQDIKTAIFKIDEGDFNF